MDILGFKHGLKAAVERMARAHGVERVRDHFNAGRFHPQQEAVRRWLLWQDFKAALPTIGKFVVGAATVAGVVAGCMGG